MQIGHPPSTVAMSHSTSMPASNKTQERERTSRPPPPSPFPPERLGDKTMDARQQAKTWNYYGRSRHSTPQISLTHFARLKTFDGKRPHIQFEPFNFVLVIFLPHARSWAHYSHARILYHGCRSRACERHAGGASLQHEQHPTSRWPSRTPNFPLPSPSPSAFPSIFKLQTEPACPLQLQLSHLESLSSRIVTGAPVLPIKAP